MQNQGSNLVLSFNRREPVSAISRTIRSVVIRTDQLSVGRMPPCSRTMTMISDTNLVPEDVLVLVVELHLPSSHHLPLRRGPVMISRRINCGRRFAKSRFYLMQWISRMRIKLKRMKLLIGETGEKLKTCS